MVAGPAQEGSKACLALLIAIFLACVHSPPLRSQPSPATPTSIVLDRAPGQDVALKLALDDLRQALEARRLKAETAEALPRNGQRIVLRGNGEFRDDQEVSSQAFEIAPTTNGLLLSSKGVGLVHGAFKLAEAIRRDGIDWKMRRTERPAFAERIFSYQGILFNLPDEGYYYRHEPYVNERLLREQVESSKEAMRRLLPWGFNSVAFLNLNVEDYINYDLWGDGNRVYPPDSLHRVRSAVFCRALSELADYAHSLHLQLFLQIYEFSLPDHLEARGLTDNSAATWELVDAKFRELFDRTTIDGIILTMTEPSPRLAYRGVTLWKSLEGAGRMASHYYDTIVRKCGRRLIVRMWMVTDEMEGFNRVLGEASEPGIMFDTKETNGDFFLSVGENPLIKGGAPKLRRFSVTFDVFRQFDGWGDLLFYPVFWEERFRDARANGVVAVDAWGPWLAGCIFPGVWVGKYDEYDFVRHGFRPALASLYLFSRLAWNPDETAREITRDWAALNFGEGNVAAASKALFLSYDLWRTTYLGADDRGAFKWTMLFQPFSAESAAVFEKHSLGEILQSNRKALTLASEIHTLLHQLDARQAPNQEALREFRRAADLTLLYFRTFALWRELLWRSHSMAKEKGPESEAALRRVCAQLEGLLPEWRRYPRESRDWLIFRFDPEMNAAPDWLARTSVADTLREVRKSLGKP